MSGGRVREWDCAIVDTDWLYQIDVMTGESKETVVTPEVICIPRLPEIPRTSRNAHASRVGHVFHVQGQVPWDLQGNTAGGDDITAQAEQSYKVLDSIVRATGSTWDDVAEVTDILKRSQDHDAVSRVRGRYAKPGQYAASALLAKLVSEEILLEPELIIATEAKDVVVSPKVYRRDGGAHAVRVGRTLYLSGQAALDGDGKLVGKGAVETQVRQVLTNIEAVLEAAGGSMADVVRLDTFLARRADHSKVIAVREEVLPVGEMVVSDVVTGWVDPDVLVHMRCIAVLE